MTTDSASFTTSSEAPWNKPTSETDFRAMPWDDESVLAAWNGFLLGKHNEQMKAALTAAWSSLVERKLACRLPAAGHINKAVREAGPWKDQPIVAIIRLQEPKP